MFDQVLASPAPPSPLRRMALPAAFALQTVLGALLVVHALFGPESLAPPIALTFWEAPPALQPPPARRAPEHTPAQPGRASPVPRGMEAPNVVPAEPPDAVDAPQDYGPVTQDGPGIPGGVDGDPGSGPGGAPLPISDARPVLDSWQVHLPKPVYQPAPDYPRAAAAMRLEGRVVIQVVVDETGAVREAKVLQSTHSIFDAAALAGVRRWRYIRPVDIRSGAAVACYLTVVVNFRSR